MTKLNHTTWIITSVFLLSHAFQVAHARDKSGRKSTHSDENPIVYRQAEPEAAGDSSRGSQYSLGFSTFFSGIPGNYIPLNTSAFTGTMSLTRNDLLQAFLSIPGTSPFNIGGSLFLKHTLVEHRTSGFHIGGGVGAANINNGSIGGANFALSFSGIFGFHFEMPGVPHVVVHLDGGPTYYMINTSPSSTNSFQMTALSPALGASILYAF
jgi:hypothetical protein